VTAALTAMTADGSGTQQPSMVPTQADRVDLPRLARIF
jgi:hypothetical protein